MKILVTGSRGTLGAPLVRELRARGHDVWGCDLQHSADPQYERVDISEFRQVQRVLERGRFDLVYHLAAEFGRNNGEEYYEQLFTRCTRMMLSLQRLPIPAIARVQGIATAAGCQLVAMCDLAVASEQARFAVSGVNLGLFCSTPSVALVRNVSRKQAMEMLLTGDFIDAATALERGLVNRVVPADRLGAEIDGLIDRIIAKPRVAIAMGKEQFYRQVEVGIEDAYAIAGHAMACNMLDEAALEGVQAFVDKRRPAWAADRVE